nr:hypothetical protein [Candidatus Electrothrix aestuarii]
MLKQKNKKYFKRNRIKAVRKNALIHIFILFIALPGRIIFLAMARHGPSRENIPSHFEEFFSILTSNLWRFCSPLTEFLPELLLHPEGRNKTPHVAKFWSGCASSRCLDEISSLAVIDQSEYSLSS